MSQSESTPANLDNIAACSRAINEEIPVPASTTSSEQEIDSALLAALRDTRERLALLRLEQVFIDFIQSETDGWIEVGGPYNSCVLWPTGDSRYGTPHNYAPGMRQTTFQRCILHRLADRFGIVREPGSLLNLNQPTVGGNTNSIPQNIMSTNSLRLIKLPGSRIPAPLLQDLDSSVYNQTNSGSNDRGKPTTDASSETKSVLLLNPKKMTIMKRDKRKTGKTGKSAKSESGSEAGNSSLSRLSLSDKEKAYAEARARIFQQPSEDITEEVLETPSTSYDTDQVANCGSNLANLSLVDAGVEDRSQQYYRSSSQRTSTGSLSSVSLGQNPRNDGNITPPEGMTRKAVYRNYAEEAADPDFQRMKVSKAYTPYMQPWQSYQTAPTSGPMMVPPTTSVGGYGSPGPISYPTSQSSMNYAGRPTTVYSSDLDNTFTANSIIRGTLAKGSVLTASAPAFYPDAKSYRIPNDPNRPTTNANSNGS